MGVETELQERVSLPQLMEDENDDTDRAGDGESDRKTLALSLLRAC